MLHYSALNDRGRGAFNDALGQAVDYLREREGQARVGKGRLAVKQRLEAMQSADAALDDVSQRRHRTISQEHFRAIYAEVGGVSDPALLLDYLHRSGVVFYQPGLFADQVILDQAWALDAVYAVFNRQKSWNALLGAKGRFTRTTLDSLVWQDHSPKEQRLFLSMMESCGICFTYRDADKQHGSEAEYIAPDLLPDEAEVAIQVEAVWKEAEPFDELRLDLPFLHQGVMRGLIARIGQQAGEAALYWKGGVCLYEKTTQSHAHVAQRVSFSNAWSGSIHIRTQKGRSTELARLLAQWAREVAQWVGCKVAESEVNERIRSVGKELPLETKPEFVPPPRKATTYAVSYAWEDSSKDVVDRLCNAATLRGIKILRDSQGLAFGESISNLMRTLTEQDRVFVVLSDKYLRSPFCMYELWHLWLNCRANDAELRRRIRVYRLPDATMMTLADRAKRAVFWKQEFDEVDALVRAHGAGILGEKGFQHYKLMQDFANRVGDVLDTIADTLMPQDFENLVKYGFDEGPSGAE